MNFVRTSTSKVLVAAFAISAAGPAANAQTGGGLGRVVRECTGTFILLAYPTAPDKKTALKAMEDLRQQINSIFEAKDLCAVDKKQSDDRLKGSQFPVDTTLPISDWKALAASMRADEFLVFEVAPQGTGFQYTGSLYLSRDEHLRDPIPKPQFGDNSSQGAKWLAMELKKVRKELEFERKCYQLTSDSKYAEAEAEARKGIAAVPDGIIARVCLANALLLQKKPADQIIAVTDEILKRDPKNIVPLLLALDAYLAKGDQAKYAEVAGQVVTLDAGHPAVEGIVDNLVLWKQTDIAMPIITKALVEDPGNQKLLRNQFRLLYGGNHYAEAAAKGEQMAKLDTAVVDTIFIERMFRSYANIPNEEKVLEWLSTGFAKFPTNMQFALGVAQQLNKMGQTEKAIDAYKKVLTVNAHAPEVRMRIASFYNGLGQTDSAFAWLHKAAEGGDDKEQVSNVAFAQGATALNAASKSKSIDDFKKAIPFLAYSDSVFANDKAKFYYGIATLQIGAALAQSMQPPGRPTCEVAKESKSWMDIANDKIRTGGKADPDKAGQYMGNVLQLMEYLNGNLTALHC